MLVNFQHEIRKPCNSNYLLIIFFLQFRIHLEAYTVGKKYKCTQNADCNCCSQIKLHVIVYKLSFLHFKDNFSVSILDGCSYRSSNYVDSIS